MIHLVAYVVWSHPNRKIMFHYSCLFSHTTLSLPSFAFALPFSLDDSNRATSEDDEGVDLDSLMEFFNPNTERGPVIKDDASSKQSESSNAADGGGVTSQSQISNVVYSNTGGDPMNRAAPLFVAANPNDNGANPTARIVADLDSVRASAGESPTIETRMKSDDSISAGPMTAMAALFEEVKEKAEHSPRADPPALAPGKRALFKQRSNHLSF